jgi:hypothetical protein
VKKVETHFHAEPLAYTGRELRSHFAYEQFGVLGDSIVAFVGPCYVPIDHLVDLEDVRSGAFIQSSLMVHWIAEHFETGLAEAVLGQHLAVRLLGEILAAGGVGDLAVRGDDLFVGERKASVSIATRSPVSAMIHLGLNVQTDGAPVAAYGIAEAGLDAAGVARDLLAAYAAEHASVQRAIAKVRGVP